MAGLDLAKKEITREALIKLACEKKTDTYKSFALKLGFKVGYNRPEYLFFRILELIGEEEISHGRPPVNVLVIRKVQKSPGKGFYKFYTKHIRSDREVDTLMKDDKLFNKLCTHCYDYWSNK